MEAANLDAWSAHDTDARGRDERPRANEPCDTESRSRPEVT